MMETTTTKIDVIQSFFTEVWSNERAEVINEVFVPDAGENKTADGLKKDEKMSPEDFEAFHGALLGLIQDVVISIDEYIEYDDWVVTRCTLTANDRRSGKPVKILGSAWARVTDGKIREAHNYWDFLHLFEGLELLPENTLQTCIQGNSIG